MVDSERRTQTIRTVISFALVAVVAFGLGSAAALFPRSSSDGIYGLAYEAIVALGPDIKDSRANYRQSHNAEAQQVGVSYKIDSVSAAHGETFVIERFRPDGAFEGEDFAESDYSIKPAVYVDVIDDHLLLTQGDGSFLWTLTDSLAGDATEFSSIPTNISELLPDGVEDFGWFSIKGTLLHDGELYVSYSHDSGPGDAECWSTAIARAPYSRESLQFDNVWVSNFCIDPAQVEEFNGHQAGGALAINGSDLLFTHGDYRSRELSQDPNSFFGKLLAFDLNNLEAGPRIAATGLRNAQSVLVWNDRVWITDQGPRGGDEMNLMSVNDLGTGEANFGWPIASYGEHYDGEFREEAPLNKSHADFGFVEPVTSWVPSIAVSTVTRSPFTINGSPVTAVGALGTEVLEGDLSIHFLATELTEGMADTLSILPIGDRVRSLFNGGPGVLYGTLDSGELIRVTSQDNPAN